MSILAIALFLFAFIANTPTTSAQTQVDWLIQAQCPPVARVGQPWSWTLLPWTFSSEPNSTLLYSAGGLPSWASFDPLSAAFSGRPTRGDEGSFWVTISANSTDGTCASDGFVLLAVDEPAPTVNVPVSEQLPGAFTLGAEYVGVLDGALRTPPGRPFAITFASWTIVGPTPSTTVYYAASEAGTTRLPSWLRFDNRTVTFFGTAPPEAEGSQHEIDVFDSDHYGYGDAKQRLLFIVASHSFDLLVPFLTINATPGSIVNYTIPLGNLRIDNVAPSPDVNVTLDVNLVHAPSVHAPSLAYDPGLRLISGQLPDVMPDRMETYLPVTETLTANIDFHVTPRMFVSDRLPTFFVKPGRFELDLSQYLTSRNDSVIYSAVFMPPESSRWMSFNPRTMKLRGTGPYETPIYGDTTVEFSAFDMSRGIHANASLLVQVAPRVDPLPTPTSDSPVLSNSSSANEPPTKTGIGIFALGVTLLVIQRWF
jgi:axial budding pattern protein 2